MALGINMSFFKGSTSKKDKKDKRNSNALPEVIQKLRETEDLLLKKQEFLENKIKKEVDVAKGYAKSNKNLALQALKRKKRYENYLRQVDGTLATLEMQRETLESSQTDQLVVDSMKIASQALKTAHKQLDVEAVHNIMDDAAEEREKVQEITDAISRPVGFSAYEVDEDELLQELEEMEQEELDRKMLDLQLPSTSQQPPAPLPPIPKPKKSKIAVTTDDEEEELAAMGQWAKG